MLTGASPGIHGVLNTHRSSPRKIPSSLPTLGELLAREGYATAGETDRGYVSEAFGFDRGFAQFRAEFTRTAPKVDRALAWFDALPPGTPGFFFLHTYEAHAPYVPPPDLLEAVLSRHPLSVLPSRIRRLLAQEEPLLEVAHAILFEKENEFTRADASCLAELYAASVLGVDRAIGRLVEGLAARGLLERTVLVLTSDHGEEFLEHGGYEHGTVYDEVIRVPLLFRLPGRRGAGTRVATTFPGTSLVPTLLEILELPAAQRIDGRSRARALLGGSQKDDLAFATQFYQESTVAHAVRSPRVKLIRSNTGKPDALYDLAADPDEHSPLEMSALPEGSRFLEALKAARAVWIRMAAIYAGEVKEGTLDPELEAQLRGLGYLR
jgi:arylsulfatase A-like enzyme